MTNKAFDGIVKRRIKLVLLFFLVAFGALWVRLFMLQIVHHRNYVDAARKQHQFVEELSFERGRIMAVDRGGDYIPLALNQTKKTLIASPRHIVDPERVANILAQQLKTDHADIFTKLSKSDDPYEIIAKEVAAEAVLEIENEGIEGLFFDEERRRFYPYNTLAAHALGFVSVEYQEETGRYGLERYYEEELTGRSGFLQGLKDAAGFLVVLGNRIINPSENGSDVVLHLDYNIQLHAEKVLAEVLERWDAPSGLVIVTEPSSGAVMALAAAPTFNPNAFSQEKDFSIFLNPAVQSIYELGSVVKPLTLSAAFEEGVLTPESTYYDTGSVTIGKYTIKNFDEEAYGTQTMAEMIEKSLNTGAVYAAKTLGKQNHREYLKKFGFGQKTGIDMPGEVAGNISNLDALRDIDFATASFGQGIALTPLQLAMAIGTIANGGELMQPSVVKSVIDDSGNEIVYEPRVRRRVLSSENAESITKMLVSAVRNGFQNKAGVEGYFVAGKTGTAQIPNREGSGYSDEFIHVFTGYAPAFDPKFLIYLQLNEPQGNRFSANTLTPAFHDLAEFILNYYEIPPDDQEE